MNSIQIICFIVLVVIVIGMAYCLFNRSGGSVEVREFITEKDDPELAFISQCRKDVIDTIFNSIAIIWNFNKDDYTLDIKTLDFNINLITILHNNSIYRIYCNWSKKKIEIEFIYSPALMPQKTYTRTLKVRLKNGQLPISKIEAVLRKWYFELLAQLNKTYDDKIINACITGITIAKDKKYSDDRIVELLFDAWDSVEIRKKPHQEFADIAILTKLTAFLARFYPDKLNKILHFEADDKDTEENE